MGFYNGVEIRAKDFRLQAHNKCKRLSKKLCLIALLYIVISSGVGVIGGLTSIKEVITIGDFNIRVSFDWLNAIVAFVISGPLLFGLITIDKMVYDEKNDIAVSSLFSGFLKFGPTFVIHLLVSIFTFLWSLLFIIPGIIKSISYSMAMYIYHDDTTLSPKECINKSKAMMHGHKWDYFCLIISYIGWIILCVLTLGILLLWVLPKMQQATYIFYQNVSGKINNDDTTSLEENLEF